MADNNIDLGVQVTAEVKSLLSGMKAIATSMNQTNDMLVKSVKNFNQLNAAMDRSQNQIIKLQKQSAALQKERHQQVVTTKKLISSETLLGSIYAKNSALAQKKYMTNLTGLRKGLSRFREETARVVIMEKGHISMLDEQSNAMKRFAIQANMVSRTLDTMATKYLNLGKNLQWTGRQMMVGITMPLAAGAYGAVRSYLEWDKAIQRTTKLLNDQKDASGSVVRTAQEQSEALKKTATELSTTYGVARANVMGDTMGIFAQIGAAEEDIKRLSKMSLEFNMLGDLDDPQKAGEMVRVLFQNFRAELGNSDAAIKEAQKTVQIFNTIEDATSLSMEGIAEAYPKIANTLRRMKVGAGEGIAYLTAMTQNGVPAVEAANALRFALTKLPAAGAYLEDPALANDGKMRLKELTTAIERYNETAAVADRIDLFNADQTFKGADVAIMQIAKAWGTMGEAQKEVFNRALAGANQSERLGTLFENVGQAMSGNLQQDFAKAITLANDGEYAASQWNKQLETLKESDYIQWQNTLNRIKNTMQDIGQVAAESLLPVANKFADWLERAFGWFQALSPETRKWMLSLVGLAAVIGPITYGLGQLVILSAQVVKTMFTKPLKGLFHIRESLGGAVVKSEELQKKVNQLMSDYFERKIDRNTLKSGIEDVIAEEARLEHQTKRTTAALREQGQVDATPNVAGAGRPGAAGVPAAVQQGRTKSRLKSIFAPTAGVASALNPRTRLSFSGDGAAFTEAQLQQIAPQILAEALEDAQNQANWKGKMTGKSPVDLSATSQSQQALKKALGVESRFIPNPGVAGAGMELMAREMALEGIERQLAVATDPAYIDTLERQHEALKEEAKTTGLLSKAKRRERREYQKISEFLVKNTRLRPDQVADSELMGKLVGDMRARLPESYLGNPVLGERQLAKAFDKMFDELGDALPPEVGRRTGYGSRGVYTERDAGNFVKELNNRGVISDMTIDRDESGGTRRSATLGSGRSMKELLGFDFMPNNVRDVYTKLNEERIMAYMKEKEKYQLDPNSPEVLEILSSDDAQKKGWTSVDDIIEDRINKDMGRQVKEFFGGTNESGRIRRGKKVAQEMGEQWAKMGFGDGAITPEALDQFMLGGLGGGKAAVKPGDLLRTNKGMMELIVRRLSGATPDKELFKELAKQVVADRKVATAEALEAQRWFDETVSPSSFGGDMEKYGQARARIMSEARSPLSTLLAALGFTETKTGGVKAKNGANKAQIAKVLDDLGDQFIEARVLDQLKDAVDMSIEERQEHVRAAQAEARRWREYSTSSMIRATSSTGMVGDKMESLGGEDALLARIFGEVTDQDVARDNELAGLRLIDQQLDDMDAEIQQLDTKRRSLFRRYQNNTKRALDTKIRDLEALRDEARVRRAQAANRLQLLMNSGRTGEFMPDGTEVTGKVFDQEDDPQYEERMAAREAARARASKRLNDQMRKNAQAGLDERFDRGVRAKIAGQTGSKKYKASQVGKALFSGGLLGRFDGGMDPEEMRARAMVMERNEIMGMTDRKVSRKDIRSQRRANQEADAAGITPDFDMSTLEREEDKKVEKEKKAKEKADKKRDKEFIKSNTTRRERIGSKLSTGGKGILNAATWAQPTNAIKKTGDALSSVGKQSKTLGRLKDVGKGLFPVFDMLTMGMGSMGATAVTSLGALGPLIPIFAIIAGIGLLIWKNWDKVSKGIGGGLKALKDGFMGIVDAVIGPFKDMFSDLSSDGESMGDMWEGVGNIINVVGHVIGAAFDFVAGAIRPVMEIIANFVRIIIDIVRLVVALVTGDWSAAWEAFRDVVGSVVIAVGNMMVMLPGIMLDVLSNIIGFFADVVDKIPSKILGVSTGAGAVKDMLNGASDAVNTFGDTVKNLPETLGKKIRGDKKAAKKAGEEVVEQHKKVIKDEPPVESPGLEPNEDSAIEAAEDERKAYVESFVGAFQGQMRKVVDGWKEAALTAYDDWVQGQQDAIDAQIDGLNDLTKAEEEALRKREYLRRKEEMALRMRQDKNRYTLDREKLIYEGKYDEASQLDSEYGRQRQEAEREVAEFEEEHQRELTLAQREGQIERLEQEKAHSAEMYAEQKKALQAQLDAITEYIPKNQAEAEKMQQAILGSISGYIGAYGTMATQAQEAWRGSWNTAWGATTKEVAEQSFWSGKEALRQFAKGLGIDPSVVDDAVGGFTGVSGGAPAGTSGGGSAPMAGPGSQYHQDYLNSTGARKPSSANSNTWGRPIRGYFHTGGNVGNTSMAPSDVPATLQTGEYVIQRKSVAKLGKNFLDRVNEGNVYHTGGIVGPAFKGAAAGAFNSFLSGTSKLGSLSWDDVKNSYMAQMGGGGGNLGPGFYGEKEDPGDFVKTWLRGTLSGLNKSFAVRVAKYAQALGRPLGLTSGFRTMQRQAELKRQKGIMAAAPGGSWHEKGFAIDHSPHSTPAMRQLAEKMGLYYPMASLTGAGPRRKGGIYEPWHIQPIETAGKSARDYALGTGPGMTSDDAGVAPENRTGIKLAQSVADMLSGAGGGGSWATGPSGGPVKDVVKGMMAQFGFGSDQWPSLERLVHKESSWNPAAANPTSSARGLFQFLKSTWASYISGRGGPAYWSQDVGVQARGGLQYIKDRYGNPQKALQFHDRNNWYHQGGIVVPKFHDGNYRIANTGLAEVARGEKIGYDDQMGGSGEIHLHIGQFFGTDREIEKLGKELQRVMAKANRASGGEVRTFNRK